MSSNIVNHTFVVCAYKESKYLEECIQSLLNQTVKSQIIIATSTPNSFIKSMAEKYALPLEINKESLGIGYDFDFALAQGKTKFVTVAHQDDKYCPTYTEKILNKVSDDTIIAFTDYFEGRKDGLNDHTTNLKIKKILLFFLRFNFLSKFKFFKRSALRLGCAICCPAVTFNTSKVKVPVFASSLKCNVDWYAWEKLSKLKGKFTYVHEPLMIHRIHQESTTSKILENNQRVQEDYYMFNKFWPKSISKLLCKVYVKSEKSNSQ